MTTNFNWNFLLFFCCVCVLQQTGNSYNFNYDFDYNYDYVQDPSELSRLPPPPPPPLAPLHPHEILLGPVRRFYFSDYNLNQAHHNHPVEIINRHNHEYVSLSTQAPVDRKSISKKSRLLAIEKSMDLSCGRTTSSYISGGRDAKKR